MAKSVRDELDLHLKDYDVVRKDMDRVLGWLDWGFKIILGAVLLAILALIGLGK